MSFPLETGLRYRIPTALPGWWKLYTKQNPLKWKQCDHFVNFDCLRAVYNKNNNNRKRPGFIPLNPTAELQIFHKLLLSQNANTLTDHSALWQSCVYLCKWLFALSLPFSTIFSENFSPTDTQENWASSVICSLCFVLTKESKITDIEAPHQTNNTRNG